MRVFAILIFCLNACFAAFAQPTQLDDFVSKLKAKGYSSDIKLLRKTLEGSHREFLRNYKAYSELDDAFISGNFDCLSGTILLSHIFDRLKLAHKIYETNYHIFLIVQTSEGDAIVETTDKDHGLVTNKHEIERRLKNYKEFGQGSDLYLSKLTIFNEINNEQMEGLVLFNKAISSFLQNDFLKSYNFLRQAKEVYNTPRISEFSRILMQQIAASKLEEGIKGNLIERLKSFTEERISRASTR